MKHGLPRAKIVARMVENPYKSPAEAQEVAVAHGDALRWPAIGCVGSALVGIAFASYQLAFYMSIIEIARRSASNQAIENANEMLYGSYVWAGLSILAIVAAVCMLARRGRWFVLTTSVVGVAVCIPAPLAIVVLMRVWRKDVWDSFR